MLDLLCSVPSTRGKAGKSKIFTHTCRLQMFLLKSKIVCFIR